MAAVIDLRTGSAVLAGPVHTPAPAQRPCLSLIEGGRSAEALHQERIYRWRRVFAASVAIVVVLAVASVVHAGVSAITAPPPLDGLATQVHQVRPGDTLWGLAAVVDPDADPRDVVDQIVRLNEQRSGSSFSGAQLRAGQEVLLPAAVG